MFEPGQKIQVVESSLERGTGPVVGSIGFISEVWPVDFGVFFHKMIWVRYGNKGKTRIESGHFSAIPADLPDRAISYMRNSYSSRVGRVKIIPERRNLEDVDSNDFKAWLLALLRIQATNATMISRVLREVGFRREYLTPKFFDSLNIERDYGNEGYLELATAARKIKNIHLKQLLRKAEKQILDADAQIQYHVDRYGWGQRKLRNVVFEDPVRNRRHWHNAFYVFSNLIFANILAKEVKKIISKKVRHKKHWNELFLGWKKYCGIK